MMIESLKTKVKVVFPEASEIFMAEEFVDELQKIYEEKNKLIELDLGKVETVDTTFIQIFLSLMKTLKNNDMNFKIKEVSQEFEENLLLYGININELS